MFTLHCRAPPKINRKLSKLDEHVTSPESDTDRSLNSAPKQIFLDVYFCLFFPTANDSDP